MGEFKNILKQMRLAAQLTQDDLARKTGINRSSIGMYETGARRPDFETLEILADFFNVDIDYLIGRTEKTTFTPETIGAYYTDPETLEIANEILNDPDRRALFDASRGSTPDAMRFAAEMLEKFKKTNPDG